MRAARLLVPLALALATVVGAALTPAPALAQRFIKGNLASTLVGIPQVGVEHRTGPRTTFQVDLIVSPWQSIRGKPFQFGILVAEQRWHRNPDLLGFYAGVNAGLVAYHMQKPFYWGTDYFQYGFGAVLGGTVGYKWEANERWSFDAFAGGGTVQSVYKGKLWSTGEPYAPAEDWNKSGELVPYRVGLMLARRM